MKNCLESDLCNQHLINCSPEVLKKLNSFFMLQRELSQALLVARPLGTCKITTLIEHGNMTTVFSDVDLKETL